MSEQPPIKPWMEEAEALINADEQQAIQGLRKLSDPSRAASIAQAYEPTAKRVQALVSAIEGIHWDHTNPEKAQRIVTDALDDYRKGKE